MKQTTPISSLERPLFLTSFFSHEKPVWTLADLARVSGLPKASCLRALRALERFAVIQRFEGGYRLGTRLLELGGIVQASYPARRVAMPFLEQLRDQTLQSTQWVIRDGNEGIYLDVFESRARVRMYIAPGRRAPLYAGASTRLILTFSDAHLKAEILGGAMRAYTEITPCAPAELEALIDLSARTWLAASFGELEPHSAEIAAPVFGLGGEFVAAISLAGTAAVFADEASLLGYLEAVSKTAEEVSRTLGYSGPWQTDPRRFLQEMPALSPDRGRAD
ncbi:IclR family transcriptional regulator [Pandoraea thiooxydans]|uniref:IclR family transcriptional regulator n=1 Tax=Pandoraea thiooxydans TaxID=445709 RepID=A0A0G3ES60_9BURK|nr:IclR family transcriptional regulator [Pandoraea thiooxydans]AKJ68177.1 IclR family transcriptional regulator [Pandoraea thiooxydans]APR95467.1 IclR family transcriptional regulator [Pandoraea thiooxydans]